MSEVFSLLLVGVIVLIVVSIVSNSRKNNTSNSQRGSASYVNRARGGRGSALTQRIRFSEPVPASLGIEVDHPAYSLVKRYERSWSAEYAERLKLRVQAEHPEISDAEYAYRKLELDRFFILCAILKEAPMFSESVDQLWHEMLMFTSEYDRWSERYMESKIHHQPAMQKVATPQLRAWFDWVYSQLFPPTPYTTHFWGAFFRKPMDLQQLKRIVEEDEKLLSGVLFRADTMQAIPEVRQVITYLKQQAGEQIASAATYSRVPTLSELQTSRNHRPIGAPAYWRGFGSDYSDSNSRNTEAWIAASSVMLIASMIAYDDYEQSVEGIMGEAEGKYTDSQHSEDYEQDEEANHYSSGCSGSSEDGGDSSSCSSSDDGGSSCSSCSSCSSD